METGGPACPGPDCPAVHCLAGLAGNQGAASRLVAGPRPLALPLTVLTRGLSALLTRVSALSRDSFLFVCLLAQFLVSGGSSL